MALTRAEMDYFTRIPNILEKINDSLGEIAERIETEPKQEEWSLVHDEETKNGKVFGVLSNGEHCLFVKTDRKTITIYNSITFDPQTKECSFAATEKNAMKLIDALNGAGDNYCGAGSVLENIKFD